MVVGVGKPVDVGELESMSIDEVMSRWVPGSQDQPWTWDDEKRDIEERVCACCDQPGHYQRQVVERMRREGAWWDSLTGPMLGNDGRVWDGHHRIVAANDLGIAEIPVEVVRGDE